MSDSAPQRPDKTTKASGLKGFIVNHKVWSTIIAMFVVGVVATAASSTPTPGTAAPSGTPTTEAPGPTDVPSEAPTEARSEAPAPTEAPQPELTVSQENAIASAKDYLGFSGFSEMGLIDQLSSKYGEGFPKKDAIFAVNYLNVNWNEQAAKSANSYLDTSSFSCQGLIQQLGSSYGEGFTHAQAVYGAKQTGVCG